MATYKEEFIAFMNEHGIKYTDLDERAVRLAFASDVVPQGVTMLVIFDSDNRNAVHFMASGFAKVPENKFGAVLMAVNEANAKFRWVKFYINDGMNIMAEDDAILDMTSVGSEVANLAFRLSDIVDEAYPSFMSAIYS